MMLKQITKMTNGGLEKLKGQKYYFRQVYFHKLSVSGGFEFGLALPHTVLLIPLSLRSVCFCAVAFTA